MRKLNIRLSWVLNIILKGELLFINPLYLTSFTAVTVGIVYSDCDIKNATLSKTNMFSLQPKANVKCGTFCGMQKSGRLHRKQPGFCVDRVRGIIGFSAKVCAWGKLYWSEPLLRGIDREVESKRDEPKTKGKHTKAEFGDTQWKPHLLCVNWHVEAFTVENTCSRMCCLASDVVMLNLCVYLKCQWYFRSITLNQAPSVSSVNPLYETNELLKTQWLLGSVSS